MRVALVCFVLLALAAGAASAARASGEGTVMSQSTATQASVGGCRTLTTWRGFKLLIGIFAWKYKARIYWCWNGRKITSFRYRRWAEVYVPFWDFKGHIAKSGYGGEGLTYATRFTQGKFKQCAQFCVQTKTPWIRQTVTRKGGWSADTGG